MTKRDRKWRPDHDVTATKTVTFHNAIVGVSISVASIHGHSSIIMVQIKTRLIAEDVIMPVDRSLVVFSKFIAKLAMPYLVRVYDMVDGSEN